MTALLCISTLMTVVAEKQQARSAWRKLSAPDNNPIKMSAACEAASSTPEIGSSQPIASQLMNSGDLDNSDDDSDRNRKKKSHNNKKIERRKMSREAFVTNVVHIILGLVLPLSKTFYSLIERHASSNWLYLFAQLKQKKSSEFLLVVKPEWCVNTDGCHGWIREQRDARGARIVPGITSLWRVILFATLRRSIIRLSTDVRSNVALGYLGVC